MRAPDSLCAQPKQALHLGKEEPGLPQCMCLHAKRLHLGLSGVFTKVRRSCNVQHIAGIDCITA